MKIFNPGNVLPPIPNLLLQGQQKVEIEMLPYHPLSEP
jgi:hypothetical protein